MSDEEVDPALQRADRWSKIIALGFAIGLFAVATVLTDNVQFNASVSAMGAVGVRIYIPYHASIAGDGTAPSQAHPDTGNYHHGAVGAGLVAGSLAAIGVMAVEPRYYSALGVGVVTCVVSYLMLRSVLPP